MALAIMPNIRNTAASRIIATSEARGWLSLESRMSPMVGPLSIWLVLVFTVVSLSLFMRKIPLRVLIFKARANF